MSFFGFDTTLPEHRGQQQQRQPQQQQQKQSRFATNDSTSFGHGFPEQQDEDDLATFTWGEGASTNLLEGGDELNDETFGGGGNVGMFWSSIYDGARLMEQDEISNGTTLPPQLLLSPRDLLLVLNRDTDPRLFKIPLLLPRMISIVLDMRVSHHHILAWAR
jgi:hypothetical protein